MRRRLAVQRMAAKREEERDHRQRVKEELSQSRRDFDTRQYVGHHPLLGRPDICLSTSRASLAQPMKSPRLDESNFSARSHSRQSNLSATGLQGHFSSARRGLNLGTSGENGRRAGSALSERRKFDAVADALNRIEARLQRGAQRRQSRLEGRVS